MSKEIDAQGKMAIAKSLAMLNKIKILEGITNDDVDLMFKALDPIMDENSRELQEHFSDALLERAELKRLANPIVVARALELYEYNVGPMRRVEEWWDVRFPGEDMLDTDYSKWVRRFRNNSIPRELDPWSLVAYVEAAMNKYGASASKEYGSCGFYTRREILDNEDSGQFGPGEIEAMKEVSGNDTDNSS